ncbi:cytochrome c oxidase subunit 4 [Saxibacter everestensis]|uniref:Cytochrome c oxidase polypeptide 4 n=1 Tax=Saxibacter everestensis TaxID=2909229 RepID=A0ABY8QWU2_9MICO|nr:cytochrome c oxidase subunit 4 [Brevibacteriaceae bacterium ZFBP1038]
MKFETWLFLGGVGFFAPVAIVYSILTDWQEPVGAAALFLTAGLALLIGGYLYQTSRRIDKRPEDNPNARIEDGDSELGFFSPWSWWPIILAGSAAIMFLGLAVAYWIMAIGAFIGIVAIVGWVYEYSRGDHAH